MKLQETLLQTAWVLIAAATVRASPVGDCPPVDPLDHTDHLPDSKNCSLFYKCDHAAPVLFECPDGLHFNRDLQVCDWPNTAGCAGGSAPTEAPGSPKPTTTTAPSTAPSTSATSTTTNTPSVSSEDCPAIGTCPQYEDENSIAKHLPHASNCSQFCKCDHGKPVLFDCPAGLHFNPVLEVCDWPNNAGCEGGSQPTQAPSSPKPTTTAAPSTATSTSATSTTTNTPAWSTPTHTPTSPKPTSSATSTTTNTPAWSTPTHTPTSPKPTTTTAPSEDCPAIGTCPQYEDENSIAKHLPHASNCSQFCKCDHGKPVKFDCPAGLHFNPVLEVCDWPNKAGCEGGSGPTQAPSSPKPTTTTASSSATSTTTNTPAWSTPTHTPTSPKPTTTTGPSEDCPAIGTCPQYEDENSIAKHLPHASNCSQFCKCDHGKPVLFDCPAGLHFNAVLEVCDWPYRAGCECGSN